VLCTFYFLYHLIFSRFSSVTFSLRRAAVQLAPFFVHAG